MTNTITLTYIGLVLDLPAPVVVVDVDGQRVGDLGDVVEPLDVSEEGEELSIGDRIEQEQTEPSVLVWPNVETQPPQQYELGTQLYKRI